MESFPFSLILLWSGGRCANVLDVFAGEFADVYRATLKSDSENETVAVKILKVGL